MSGHNKWSSIKHKKAAADAKRGKIFSTLSKEITLAAREGGGDLELNPRLRTAVAAARAANMPNDNVQRAIKKGTGELGGGALEELSYEGYAPGGVAVLVNCLSDNRNRTAANVRTCFTRHNSNLASTGAVGWLFQRKARFVVDGSDLDEDKLLELLLEGGVDVEDVTTLGDGIEVLAPPEAFAQVAQVLDNAGIAIRESGQTMTPENTIEITDPKTARQVVHLIEALEEDEDVQEVFTNFEMSDELMEQLANE
ncbi:MAG: YebC/PmpR family DNA-binding transcriptional regulator [Kiritimatiellaeota bacterium]|nr:YebC/PmpR family DNA-binding transcriptional regulator [Kiritimatiellota bacterium]